MSSQLGGISSLQTPPGNPRFVDLKSYYQCPFCKQVLRDSMQTTCGHRMCERCVPKMFEGRAPPVKCPAEEEDCESQTKDSIIPDPGARREVRKLKVYCGFEHFGCKETPPWKDLEKHEATCEYKTVECLYKDQGCTTPVLKKQFDEHVQTCGYRPTPCQHCGLAISSIKHEEHQRNECEVIPIACRWMCGSHPMNRRELQQHLDVCPSRPKECSFRPAGCQFIGNEQEVSEHMLNATNQHLELATVYIAKVEVNTIEIRRELQEMRSERDQFIQQNQTLSTELNNLKTQMKKTTNDNKELKMKMVSITERLIHLEKKAEDIAKKSDVDRHEKEMKALQKSLTEVRTQTAKIENQGGSGQSGVSSSPQEVQELKRRLDVHDTQFAQSDVQFAELDLRFQILESSNFNGILLWKLRDYPSRKREAVSGKTLSLYSQPFYTHRFGYKMCARVYLNGDGVGKGDHMSLFFVIMKGEYDALLPWPFQQKVTMILLDQERGSNSLSDTFKPDPTSNSFQRPTSDMNIASGCPKFVKHSTLESPRFIKDDVLFLKFVVDLSGLNHP